MEHDKMYKNLLLVAGFAAFLTLSGCSSNKTYRHNYAETYEASEQGYYQNEQYRQEQKTPRDQNTIKPLAVSDIPSSGAPIGGSIEKAMDKSDRNRMLKALDKAPGKPTTWTNNRTSIKYVVVPTRKIVINDNPFCRKYQTTASRGESTKQMFGTACVGSDGNWHSVE